MLFLVDPMDEVAIQNLKSYKEKNFVDISKENLDLGKFVLWIVGDYFCARCHIVVLCKKVEEQKIGGNTKKTLFIMVHCCPLLVETLTCGDGICIFYVFLAIVDLHNMHNMIIIQVTRMRRKSRK